MNRLTHLWFVGIAIGSLFIACGPDTPTPGADAGTPPGTAPTWHDDVAPIIAQHCQRCHQQGGIAPFPLENYAQTKPLATMIAAATTARTMPPFLADNSGDCNTWKDANWLSEGAVAKLALWAQTGAAEGVSKPPPTPPSLPRLDNPDLTVSMSEAFTPDANLVDEYRCFVIDPALTEQQFVTEFEVVPGDRRVVHHVILYRLKTDDAQAEAERRAGLEPRPGYSCYGGAGVPSTMVAAWAPGSGATTFPAGTGLPLEPNRKLILQLHYNMAGGSFPDQTAVKLRMVSQVDQPAVMGIVGNNDLEIPAGAADHVATKTITVRQAGANARVNLWGILPHMHELGTTYRLERMRQGAASCLMDIQRWDFNWQFTYFLDQPIILESTDALRTTCRFDASDRTEVTRFGEGTSDEMCLAILYITRAP